MAFVWEQRKFGSLLNEIREKTTIENEDTLLSCAIDGMYLNSELFSHFRGQSNIGYLKVKKNDLILSAQNLHLGNCNVNLRFEHGIISPAYKVYELVDCNPLFVQAWIKMDKTKDFFLKSSTEGASVCRKNILWEELYKQELVVPAIEEQTVIGTYFEQFDQLITLHQRKRMLRKCFFSIDWEQRKFVEFVKNAAKKNKDNIDLEPYAVTNDRGFIAQKDAHDDFGYMSNVDRTAYNIVPPNSFAYNPARINVGSLGYYEGTENVIVSSLYEVFQTEEYIDDKFLLHWFKSDSFPRWIEKLQEGSVRLYFYFDKLVQCQMMVPSLEEQKRISAYLDSIDQLITLHQCKSNFCKKNEVNAWEQRKLGDITESYSGGTPTAGKKEYYDGNIPFIRSGEISSDKTELFISEEGLNRSSAKMVKIGDILYALYGATSGEVSISKLKGAINQAILAIQPHQNYDSQFLMQWLRKSKENIIGTYLQGGQGNLSGNIVKELIIDIPTYEEQKEIGAYLKKLDHLITLHQWECNINENTEGNDEKQRKPIKKLIISEGNLSLVDDMFLLHRMTFLVCNKYILLRLNVVKYKITIIIISNILYSIVSLLIIACYLIVINKQLIILIYVEISVVIIKGDDDYARIRS